ncbi:hypothetical protein D3C74_471220 [compost metagenome]
MMRFILKSSKDKLDNAEIITNIDKLTVCGEYMKWLECYVEDGSFSNYLFGKYPDKTVIDLDDIEDCSIEV